MIGKGCICAFFPIFNQFFVVVLQYLQGNISEQNCFRQRKVKGLEMCFLAPVYKGYSLTSFHNICSSVSLLNMSKQM